MKTIFLFLIFAFFLSYNGLECAEKVSQYNDFDSNPYVTKEERKALAPYLLPLDHPAKWILDSIFLSQRASLNEESFAAAGFITLYSQPRSFIKVARYPGLCGYLVKVYLDTELRDKQGTPGWKWFARRIKGANTIRNYIEDEGIKHFVAPRKWVYPLPLDPPVPQDLAFKRKNEILVVEEMPLVSEQENLHAWKHYVTKEHLKEFYRIITIAGGCAFRPDNVVYTREGKFAFIDTEYPGKMTDYSVIIPYLSDEMAAFWKRLVKLRESPY